MAADAPLRVFIWVFSMAGAALVVVSCGSTFWQKWDLLSLNEGLWQSCNALTGCSDVKMYTKGEDELNVVRGLVVLGILLIAITMLIDIVGACCRKNVAVAVLIMQILGVACVGGGLGLYTKELKKEGYEWGWSYMLGWAGVGVYLVAFLLVIVLICRS